MRLCVAELRRDCHPVGNRPLVITSLELEAQTCGVADARGALVMAPSRSVRARALLASLLLLLLAETDALHLALASRGATRLLVCAQRPAALVMETMETKTREGVVSKGHPHTEESRMKISRANKGKKPWNVGKKHSEETKRKIALKTREAYLRRKEAEETRLRTEEPEKWADVGDCREVYWGGEGNGEGSDAATCMMRERHMPSHGGFY